MISLISFSYDRGPRPPPDECPRIDCRAIHDPTKNPATATMSGLDEPLQRYVETDPRATTLIKDTVAQGIEGKIVKLAFGCGGEGHRAAGMVERIGQQLAAAGCLVKIRHLMYGIEKELP